MTTSIDAMCSILLVSMVLSGTANADATMTVAGFRLDEGFPSSSSNETSLIGPEPIRTISPAFEGFASPGYYPTGLTNAPCGRMDVIGSPTPIPPFHPDMPMYGTNSLGTILGPWEMRHVFNSLNWICGDDRKVAFERRDGLTRLTFETGLKIVIDDTTGRILAPPDLPSVSDEELAELTWERMETSGELVKWRTRLQETADAGTILRRLSEVRLDEILRVSDKAFVAWRLVEWPMSDNGSFLRIVHWVDVPSGEVISSREEYHSVPPIITTLP